VRPVHKFPELELEPSNLITLCGFDGSGCHFVVGHRGDFRDWVPGVATACEFVRSRVGNE
jgi:5-methylcytosine-specific restriction enzyme A